MTNLHVVILAAGKGTRMKSGRPKVLHQLAGRTLIEHVLATVSGLDVTERVIVIGHGADDVRAALAAHDGLRFVVQSPQLGTGHALLQAEPALAGRTGTVLLLYADVPLLEAGTLSRLLETHRAARAAATVLTADLADPYGYGRIVRDASGDLVRIVEERDASASERAVREVNSGIYAFELEPLFSSLHQLATDNAQGEYYLTDLIAAYRQQGARLATLRLSKADELRGVNSRVDLAELTAVLRQRKCRDLMLSGVTLEDPATTYVDADVQVGEDTVLAPGVRLTGRTRVGRRCQIHSGARIADSTLADEVTVLDGCVVQQSTVGTGVSLGPFAHLRPLSEVGDGAHIGNFVELKKTRLGPRSKAGHLTYLGDALIGADVNVGAGVITCNYDGVQKHETIIEDGVFVGSDSQLIAPVTIGAGAYIAAGSSVTMAVPSDALAVARAPQTNKPGWAASRRARKVRDES
jgi:bifunctional UDP-N-acetylglucosamine pyrophosphorylase/glucosamine-1-phosphate N-acetyltransferase